MGINKAMLIASAAVLGTAGAAHAATVGTDSVSLTALTTAGGSPSSSHSGTGSGTLDDGGTYTATFTNVPGTIIGKAVTLSETDTIAGTYAAGTFTATASGSSTDVTGCSGSAYCAAAQGVHAFTTVTGSLTTVAGGTIVGKYASPTPGGGSAQSTYTFDAGPFTLSGSSSGGTSSSGGSTVPLPPAAWLLGSGLLGLVGTARRRRKA